MQQWKLYRQLQAAGVDYDSDEERRVAAYETLLLSMSLLDTELESIPEAEIQIVLETLRVQLGLSKSKHRDVLARLKAGGDEDNGSDPLRGGSGDGSGLGASPFETATVSYRIHLLQHYSEMSSERRVFHCFPTEEQYSRFVRRQRVVICLGIAFAALDASSRPPHPSPDAIVKQLVDIYPKLDPARKIRPGELNYDGALMVLIRLVSGVSSEPVPYVYPLNAVMYCQLLDVCYDESGSPLWNMEEVTLGPLRRVRDALFLSPILETVCVAETSLKMYLKVFEFSLLQEVKQKLTQLSHLLAPLERMHLRLLADEIASLATDYRVNFAATPEHIGPLMACVHASESKLRPADEQSAIAVARAVGKAMNTGAAKHIQRVIEAKLKQNQSQNQESSASGPDAIAGVQSDAAVILPVILEELEGDVKYYVPHIQGESCPGAVWGLCKAYSDAVKTRVFPLLRNAGITPESLLMLQQIRSISELIGGVVPAEGQADSEAARLGDGSDGEAMISVGDVAHLMLKEWHAGLQSTHESHVFRMVDVDAFDRGIISDAHNHTHSAVDLFAMLSGWSSALDMIGEAIWGSGGSGGADDSWHWWFSLCSVTCDAVRAYMNRVIEVVVPKEKLAPIPNSYDLWRTPNKYGAGSGLGSSSGSSRVSRFRQKLKGGHGDSGSGRGSSVGAGAGAGAGDFGGLDSATVSKLIDPDLNLGLCLRINSLQFVKDELPKLSHRLASKAGDFGARINALIKDVIEEVGIAVESMMTFLAVKLIFFDLREPLFQDLWRPRPPDCRLVEVLHHFDSIMAAICGCRGELAASLSDRAVSLVLLEFIDAIEHVIVTASVSGRELVGKHVFILEDDIMALEEFFCAQDGQGVEQGLDRPDVAACLTRIRNILTCMDLDSESLKKMYQKAPVDNSKARTKRSLSQAQAQARSPQVACLQPVDKAVIFCLMRMRDDKIAKSFIKSF